MLLRAAPPPSNLSSRSSRAMLAPSPVNRHGLRTLMDALYD